jgi:hypothetical protein
MSFESGERYTRSYPDSERIRDEENLAGVFEEVFEMGLECPGGFDLSYMTAADIDQIRNDGSPRTAGYMFYGVAEAALYPEYRAGILNAADLIIYSGLAEDEKVKWVELLEELTDQRILSVPLAQLAEKRKYISLGLVADHVNDQRETMNANFLVMADIKGRLYTELADKYGNDPIVWRLVHHLTLAAALLADGEDLSESYYRLLESVAALAGNYILPNQEVQPYVDMLERLLVSGGYTKLD